MNTKQFLIVLLSAAIGAGTSILYFNNKFEKSFVIQEKNSKQQNNFKTVNYTNSSQPVDFVGASSIATPAVVHVTTSFKVDNTASQKFYGDDIFQYFFGNPQQSQPRESKASGSGVIISKDGYIITNNHVIDNANDIQVSLSNNKNYTGKLIGKDKDTDLALIKIDATDLPYLNFANSDSVKIGEWVLAVGNPFNLASTVTAGIVSAKGRSINLLENINGNNTNTAIESFIQTDAAVNPGNSGGALVNTQGDLIGINTAIASPSGVYAGYAFAVPANIASKVVSDLKNYGAVQRAFLGVNIASVDNDIADKLNLEKPSGVYLQNIIKGGAAEEAGLKNEDVIIAINGKKIENVSALQEEIASHNPGDRVEATYIRKGNTEKVFLTLKNKYNEEALINYDNELLSKLGIEIENLSDKELYNLGLKFGIKVVNINSSGLIGQYTDMKKGFIITMIDDESVDSVEKFKEIISNKKGRLLIEGKYPGVRNDFLYALKI